MKYIIKETAINRKGETITTYIGKGRVMSNLSYAEVYGYKTRRIAERYARQMEKGNEEMEILMKKWDDNHKRMWVSEYEVIEIGRASNV